VNRLVSALIAHPQVIEQTAGQEDPTFGLLLDALGDAVFSESERNQIQNDPELLRRLETSYLPTITAPSWKRALSLTENRTALNSGWWTVMVAGTSGQFGLTAPQDDSEAELVALFTGPSASVHILVYNPALGAISEVTGGSHCGPAPRGRCFEGRCHECAAAEVFDKMTGASAIKCICSHQDG